MKRTVSILLALLLAGAMSFSLAGTASAVKDDVDQEEVLYSDETLEPQDEAQDEKEYEASETEEKFPPMEQQLTEEEEK